MRTGAPSALAILIFVCGQASGSRYRDQGYRYLSPRPDAQYVAPETEILVRFETLSPANLTNLASFIKATADQSGSHAGETRIATDKKTVLFRPSSGFSQNEIVTVELTPGFGGSLGGKADPIQYRFFVSRPADKVSAEGLADPLTPTICARTTVPPLRGAASTSSASLLAVAIRADEVTAAGISQAMITANGVSIPSDFPRALVTINDNPSPGYIFVQNRGSGSTLYTMMLDNNGDPVWYRRGAGRDFKVQKNGMITWAGYFGCDQDFKGSRSFSAVDGYGTDDHDLQVLEDGGYLLIGSRTQTVDMRLYVEGGQPTATVHENAVQEFTASGELIFQWRGWDNCSLTDVDPWMVDLRGGDVTFMHTNSLSVDDDGNILASHRHLSEVTKINRQTGEVIWRLGGAHNQFTWVNDELGGFCNQHDFRALGNGHYTVFDNGNGHSPVVSRAAEYELDVNSMTARLVWEFRDKPDKASWYMGNVQRLPTGNTLINFGLSGYPKALEVDPNGVKRFEMNLVPNWDTYRAFRFPWEGRVDAPYLLLEPDYHNVTLIFNKFGDPNVAYYRIYGGTTTQPTTVLDTSASTLNRLSALESGRRYYFRVTGVDGQGHESDYSNEESALVYFTDPVEPGQNMVVNGDFGKDKDGWTWQVSGSASADWRVENGMAHVTIAAGGTQGSDVQLSQSRMQLVQWKQYVLEFTAWAKPARIIQVKVSPDQSADDYSRVGYTYVPTSALGTPQLRRFSYPFAMQDPSDLNARVVINLGTSAGEVYLDNVSLKRVSP